MNLFEFFGVLVLGSLFNVGILLLATGVITKQVGGQVKQVVAVVKEAVSTIKGVSNGEK